MRFTYRYEGVLRLRDWQARQAKLREMQALNQLRQAEQELENWRRKFNENAAELVQQANKGLTLAQLLANQNRTEWIERNTVQAQKVVQAAWNVYQLRTKENQKCAAAYEAMKQHRT